MADQLTISTPPAKMTTAELLAALRASFGPDEDLSRRRHGAAGVADLLVEDAYERRLLGAARVVLDQVAAADSSRWDQVREWAGDVAQRIVDEIGHPVTDEPALGPSLRAERDHLRATIARVRKFADEMRGWCSPYGISADYADRLLEVLDQPAKETE